MTTKTILAIGDPHFKLDNLDECKIFTNQVSIYLSNNPIIDIIIVLGDVLHTHEKLHTFALNNALDFFKMLQTHKKMVYCLVGNHDATTNTIFLTTNHWMNVLKGWEGITIVDFPIKVPYEDNFIVLCPYVPNGRFVEALNHIMDWKNASIVFGHQEVDGAKMGCIVSTNVEEWKDEYPLLVSGHMHEKQRVKENVYYTGSSMQISFGEGEDKTLSKITFDKKPVIEEVFLDIKKKKIIHVEVSKLQEAIDKLKDDIEYKIVCKGNEEEFKALKNSTMFKEAQNMLNLKKIDFKTSRDQKKLNIDIKNEDFNRCLEELVKKDNDPYLTSLYEHLMFGKEDISDKDIFFM